VTLVASSEYRTFVLLLMINPEPIFISCPKQGSMYLVLRDNIVYSFCIIIIIDVEIPNIRPSGGVAIPKLGIYLERDDNQKCSARV
jgi:hypothetical protein